MVPAMIVFQLDVVQVVMVATFVEISCGVVADALFSRKMAQLMHLSRAQVYRYQLLGVGISAVAVGIVFWLLVQHFTLGSTELLAYKAYSRQLLINARHFDWYALTLGAVCSWFIQYLRFNPMLVLGGILMPLNFSIGLIFGGVLTLLVHERQAWEPFWSGVFAANSIWMVIKSVIT
jgi:hypothetical protein